MGYQLVKEGSYTYKRIGKRKLSYRVIFRQGKVYLDDSLRYTKDKKPITNDRDAVKAARLAIDAAIRGTQGTPKEMVKMRAIGKEVIENKVTESTRKDAKFWVESRLLPWLDIHCPFVADFNLAKWNDYIAFEQRNRPGCKLFNCRKYMSQILKRAAEKGVITQTFQLRNPDPKRAAGKVYSSKEIESLLRHSKGVLTLQILMAYGMGMRRSEILKLKKARINFDIGLISLKAEDTKIKQGRSFRVPDTILALLKAQCESARGEFVFPSRIRPGRPTLDNKTAWQECKRSAGVTGRFHDLRHTFITEQIMQDKSRATDICVYAGVSHDEMMRTYLHPTPDDTAYIALQCDNKLSALCGKFVEGFLGEVK